MALHNEFPKDPHVILDPSIRWFPADEALRETAGIADPEPRPPPPVPRTRLGRPDWQTSKLDPRRPPARPAGE